MTGKRIAIPAMMIKVIIYGVGLVLGGRISFLIARAVSDNIQVILVIGAALMVVFFLALKMFLDKVSSSNQ